MSTFLCLLRHGRATGQSPESDLMPEGVGYLVSLGRVLAAQGFRPVRVFSSPLLRARRSAEVLLNQVSPDLRPEQLASLTPEAAAPAALLAVLAPELPAGRILVVTHLPLIAHMARELTGEEVEFLPGTFVEIELANEGRTGAIVRRIGPESLASG